MKYNCFHIFTPSFLNPEVAYPSGLLIDMKYYKDKFYGSKAWQIKREAILARDGYQDQLEKRVGRNVEADVVHHIFPSHQYPEYRLCDWNLISISEETHKELHTPFGELSLTGERLKQETAEKNNIKYSKLILIIGLPGSGKTTLAKRILGDGLCYDLDYIAKAFRLGKSETTPAIKLANGMVKAFANNAQLQSSRVIVIRTAPKIEEVIKMNPDEIIVCNKVYAPKKHKKLSVGEMKERIQECIEYAEANDITVKIHE